MATGIQQHMNHTEESAASSAHRDWSARLLFAALAGILFLTLYPFRLLDHAKEIGNASPFLLGHGGKENSGLDAILNILLFVPFGLALGIKLRKRLGSWLPPLIYTWLAGLVLSYTIEFVQLYIPERDSGWADVITNSTGAAIGFLISIFVGRWLVKTLSNLESSLESRLTLRRVAFLLLFYFAACFACSFALQKETHLQNWFSDCQLVVGNDSTGWHHWRGRISLVEIWDYALPEEVVKNIVSDAETPSANAPLVKLEFPSARRLPGDAQESASSPSAVPPNSGAATAGDISSNLANMSAASLVTALKRTNHFSIRVVLRRPEGKNTSGDIVSISRASEEPDVLLDQVAGNVAFWFRNPVTVRRPLVEWTVPHRRGASAFQDILLSYNGSEVRLYLDGKKIKHDAMGPGAALASYFRQNMKQTELNGYAYIYYAILFLPAGMALALAFREQSWRSIPAFAMLVAAVLLAPAVLEWILLRENGRSFSPGNFVLSSVWVILGLLWMNSDRRRMPGGAAESQRQ